MKNRIILSNVNLNALPKLNKVMKNTDLGVGFNTWSQYVLNPEEYCLSDYDGIIILLDGNALFHEYRDPGEVESLLLQIEVFAKQNRSTKIYMSDITCKNDRLVIDQIYCEKAEYEYLVNKIIYAMASYVSNIVIFPLKHIVQQMGENKAYSNQMLYISSCPYSLNALRIVAAELSQVEIYREDVRKKCLLLDLDNTLWGGVIGEDGLYGIELSDNGAGRRYYDFQRKILEIKQTGIILAIVSKNNKEDVMPVFRQKSMLLKENDFVALKINWNRKSDSIRELAEELNIGLDSIVVIDDNPVEREEIRNALPEVEVCDFPEDTMELEQFAQNVYETFFYIDKPSEEDRGKTEMYHANQRRSHVRKQVSDMNDFIRALEMQITVSEANEDHVQRVAQLTQKTNQFNTTTKRYSESEIAKMIHSEKYKVFVGRVKDKYGDNGIAALCILLLDKKRAYVDEFLMSCRVMERKVEYAFLGAIEKRLYELGYHVLYANFVKTAKNLPAEKFYGKYGFTALQDGRDGEYVKEIVCPDNFALIKIYFEEN